MYIYIYIYIYMVNWKRFEWDEWENPQNLRTGYAPKDILNLGSYSLFCSFIHVQISSPTGNKFSRSHSSSGRGSEYQNRVSDRNQVVVSHPTLELFTDFDSQALRI